METHLSEKFVHHMSLQAISHKREVSQLKLQLEAMMIDKQELADQLTKEKQQTCTIVEELKEENQLLKPELNDKLSQECKNRVAAMGQEIKRAQEQWLKGHLGSLRGEIKKAQNETKQEIMKHVKSKVAVIHDHVGLVPFSCTMTDFEQKKSTNSPWYSPSFYTHPHGYKMCLRVDANGNGDSKNSHVSIFVYMVRGEYDKSLGSGHFKEISLYSC